MSNIYIAGNKNYGLAAELHQLYPSAVFASRSNGGYDFTRAENQTRFAEDSLAADVVIICSALWRFNQTLLLEAVYKKHKEAGKRTLIICVGSTIDRVKKGSDWLYGAEKQALRDYANSLSLSGVWGTGPRVTLVSFGTLSNVQHKHPDRRTMPVKKAAEYIQWIIQQPNDLHINELSVDPLQS
jgi:short-subunit dehydrogenase